MLEIKISQKGLQKVQVDLRGTIANASNLRPPLMKSVNDMIRSIHNNFQESGRPEKWTPLAASTLKQKRRLGYSSKPLIRTGALRNSVTGSVRGNLLAIGTSVEYAKFHQLGTKFIPSRPFLIFQSEDIDQINFLVLDYLTKKSGSL